MNPEFELGSVYLLVAVSVLAFQRRRMRRREGQSHGGIDLGAANLLACLNDGATGLARIVLAQLIAQQKLRQVGHMQLIEVAPAATEPTDPVEFAAFSQFRQPVQSWRAVNAVRPAVQDIESKCAAELDRAGLIAGPITKAARTNEYRLSIRLLAGLALIVIVAGFGLKDSPGFDWLTSDCLSNIIGIFIFLAVVSSVTALVFATSSGRWTVAGEKVLADAKCLYGGMYERTRTAATLTPQEIAITAGLFGLDVFAASQLPSAAVFKEAARQSSSGSSGGTSSVDPDLSPASEFSDSIDTGAVSSCGSSCGSSSPTDSSPSPSDTSTSSTCSSS